MTHTTSSIGDAAASRARSSIGVEPLGDRVRKRVVVQARERELPQPVRAERLLGPELEHELLELVEPVDDGHHAGQGAGRRAVDPADPFPQRILAKPAKKAELEQQPVHASPREDDREIAFVHRIYCAGVEREAERGYVLVEDDELLEDEALWRDDAGDDHTGWWCVRTDPFPCPADGCVFVAEFMTAAHLVLVWQERDDPNLLWHAQRAKEVGRNPRVVSYERSYRPERLVLRLGGGRTSGARGEGQEAGVFLTEDTYDSSRNRSSSWCSMQICGGREKARAYRRKRATRVP